MPGFKLGYCFMDHRKLEKVQNVTAADLQSMADQPN